MSFTHKNFYEEIFKRDLIPVDLENKDYYYGMIYSISSSLTSEVIIDFFNSNRINLFIIESSQLLANSIRLFELGYFDAAYYSLRASIELFTVLLDLYDYDDEKIIKNMDKFINNDYFVRRKQTIEYLSEWGIIFRDVAEKMPDFIKEIEKTSRKLNQKVHKSSFDNFYVRLKNKCENEHYLEKYVEEFITLLEKSIKIVAVMRLILDPIPLLMGDDEIVRRIPNLMTYSFSHSLFEIIGEKTLSEFQQTQKFMDFKEEIMGLEKRNEYVDAVVMYDFIDLNNLNAIYEQKELLDGHDLLNVLIASCSNKIMVIISSNGIVRYNTSFNNHEVICNPLKYDYLKKLDKYFNLKYDKIFVSLLNFNPIEFNHLNMRDIIYVFHNEDFAQEEIAKLQLLNKKLNKN